MTEDEDGHYLYRLMRDRADIAGLGQSVEKPLRVMDLGHDVLVMVTVSEDETPVGLLETHRSPSGAECGGSVTFDVPAAEGVRGPRWTLHSLHPLHIEPSVLCSCGHHGFIRGGQWVPA